ncbi:hypothetical protein A1O7_00985 [Cladophialophora yegresii CBS 114405]|uniref:Beta-fructofuranosidase n=1 Tax=Cladophialophora yegresii CBS 114405 TaxID=1182544 RepID=W9W951_9EURO|nr:uncharacterized protein A1O7_00985 [Cladophialophora yegresii CBS 114405]EXJ64647.1 hypothetical protein A1O7_00985 [Cladophialophora yegresii CBS 114405]
MDSKNLSPSEDFLRWRPQYHLQAPSGWMNDACGLGYDPRTGLYHVAYQWNPGSAHWKSISWGNARSRDLCSWEVLSTPSIIPESDGGSKGVFTGCLQPTNVDGQADGVLTILYTSARRLPIHYTLPYDRGSERIHMATSRDDGKSWIPYTGNPIVPGPPPELDVIGWRDPYVAEWHSMDRALGREPGKRLYGLVSGGIKDKAPAAFLYAIGKDALNSWEYLGPLSAPCINHTPSQWTGDYGVNWEVGNFLSTTDKSAQPHDYLIMSVEGCLSEQGKPHNAQMWMHAWIGIDDKGKPTMTFDYGGRLDHGRRYYAANSFWDPISQHHVVFGWLQEHDLPEIWHDRQCWSGMLSLPRVVKHSELHSVHGALATALSKITSIGKTLEPKGTYTISTLASAPHPALEKLRGNLLPFPSPTPAMKHATSTRIAMFPHPTAHLEIDVSCLLALDTRRVGLSMLHSADAKQRTTMYFDAREETFVIDRSQSTTIAGVDTTPETAPHTLFRFCDTSGTGTVPQEPLDVRALYDVSALEVFVNERTAIATRIYPDRATCFGIEVFLESEPDTQSQPKSAAERGEVAWTRSQCWEILPDQQVHYSKNENENVDCLFCSALI